MRSAPEYTAILSYQAKPGKGHKYLFSGATIRLIEHTGTRAKLYNCHFIKTKPLGPVSPKGFWVFTSGDPGAKALSDKFGLADEVAKRQYSGKAATWTRPSTGARFIRFVPKIKKRARILRNQSTLVNVRRTRRA